MTAIITLFCTDAQFNFKQSGKFFYICFCTFEKELSSDIFRWKIGG